MASHTYKIDLNLGLTSNSKAVQKELQQSGDSIESLNESMKRFQEYGIDATKEYSKAIDGLIAKQNKELQFYDEERVKIINNSKLTKKEKDEQLKILDQATKRAKAKKKELQLQEKFNKITGKIYNENSKLDKLNLKRIKAQEKLNQLLGKESKLRQGISKAASVVGKVGKVGAIAGAVAMAAGGAIVKGAIDSAEGTAQKADALKSLQNGVNPKLADELYVKTGADYATIVSAINNVASVVGGKNENLKSLAESEIRNPGTGMLLAAQNKVDSNTNYNNVFDAIRKQTGVQDTSALIQAAMKNRNVKTGAVSQQEYMLALAKLTNSGFDEETANKLINEVAKSGKAEDFIDRFNNTDFSKYVHGQMKNVAKNTDLKLSKVEDTNIEESPEAKAARKTEEMIREFQMKKEELFARILPKVLPMIEPILTLLETLLPPLIDVTNTVMPYMAKLLGYIAKGIGWIIESNPLTNASGIGDEITKAGNALLKVGETMQQDVEKRRIEEEKQRLMMKNILQQMSDLGVSSGAEAFSAARDQLSNLLPHKAQGGIVASPSICGEAGPEMVLPLNNPGRCNSIINNYNNTNNFSMNTVQSPLSLSQALNNRRFIKTASAF